MLYAVLNSSQTPIILVSIVVILVSAIIYKHGYFTNRAYTIKGIQRSNENRANGTPMEPRLRPATLRQPSIVKREVSEDIIKGNSPSFIKELRLQSHAGITMWYYIFYVFLHM